MSPRSLLVEDFGPPGVALQNNLTRGQTSKNWALVLDAAGKLATLATQLRSISADLHQVGTRAHGSHRQGLDNLRAQIVQMQDDAKRSRRDPDAANRKLTAALALIPPKSNRGRGGDDLLEPRGVPSKAPEKLDPYSTPRPLK
jgi:hypothetical protein